MPRWSSHCKLFVGILSFNMFRTSEYGLVTNPAQAKRPGSRVVRIMAFNLRFFRERLGGFWGGNRWLVNPCRKHGPRL